MPKCIETRHYGEQDILKLRETIHAESICDKLDLSDNADPNNNYEILENTITDAMSKHIPIKTVRYNKHKHQKSVWITKGLIKSMHSRDKLYMKLMKTNQYCAEYNIIKTNLRTFNRILRNSTRLAKMAYHRKRFEKCKNNVKDTWVAINEVICRNYRTNLPEIFKINGKSVKDNQIIADEFNAFFSNIGKKLTSEINRNTDVNYAQFLNNPCLLNLNFHAISTESILKVIDKLSSKNSQGHDGMSTKLLKSIKCEASEPITIIINQTFRTGIFPDKLKLAKVIPIFKKGNNTTMNNYRPISILPAVSKVFNE